MSSRLRDLTADILTTIKTDESYSSLPAPNGVRLATATPPLVIHFERLRTRPDIVPVLGSYAAILADKERREASFYDALEVFERTFHRSILMEHLFCSATSKASFSYLKQVRRCGSLLRDLYRFVSAGHKTPQWFNECMSALGRVNDSYWLKPLPEDQEIIARSLNGVNFSIEFAADEDFKCHVVEKLAKIEALLEQGELTVHAFHTLRKLIRSLASLIQPIAAKYCDTVLHWLFFCLFELSKEMGDQHDHFVRKSLRGEMNYDEQLVAAESSIAKRFRHTMPFIANVCGL